MIVDNKIQIALTNDIITEYEEQIGLHWNTKVATDLTRLLSELPNVFLITVYYNLNLITADIDDNKFVDCPFASNTDFIITNDNHFNILKNIDSPTIPILRIDKFEEVLIKHNILS